MSGEFVIMVMTSVRTLMLRRGEFALMVAGVEVLAGNIPEYGQLVGVVSTEAEVVRAMSAAGFLVGWGADKITVYSRCHGEPLQLLQGVPAIEAAKFLELDVVGGS